MTNFIDLRKIRRVNTLAHRFDAHRDPWMERMRSEAQVLGVLSYEDVRISTYLLARHHLESL